MRKYLIIILFLLLPSLGFATDYYVTQSGAGTQDGKSIGNAWSVSDFNTAGNWSAIEDADKIDPGDTVYFSGTITSTPAVQGSGTSGNHIEIDGYETDDTKYQDLSEVTGRAKITSAGDGISVDGYDYITIEDFELTGFAQAIDIGDSTESNDITLKRNYMYAGSNGIYVGSGSYNIIIGGSSGQGNVCKNIGTGTGNEDIAFSGSPHDIIISHNHLYADNANWGIDGIMSTGGNTYDVLVEYNSIHGHNYTSDGENAIDLKRSPYNWVIRYNHIYNHNEESCIIINGNSTNASHDIYIYGNNIHDCPVSAVTIQDNSGGPDYEDLWLFSNLIWESRRAWNGADQMGSDYSSGARVFNNTMSENGNAGANQYDTHMFISQGYVTAKNNVFIKGGSSAQSYRSLNLSSSADTETDAEHNRYYYPSQTCNIDWGDAGNLTLSGIQGGSSHGLPQENDLPAGSEGDPGLEDWDNGDFRISGTDSAVYGGGTDMGSGNIASLTIAGQTVNVPWDFALGPDTVWGSGSTLPVIDVVYRDQLQWSQGAYEYEEQKSHMGVTIQ